MSLQYAPGYFTNSLIYDANGNMTSLSGASNNSYAYDVENRLVTRTLNDGTTTTYSYDGFGHMVKRANSNGSATVYAGGAYEKNTVGSSVTQTYYFRAFGRTIATKTIAPSGTSSISYILSDHLGSTTQTITSAGIATQKYFSYGATRSTSGTLATDKLFTGQQQEAGDSLGLYNYKARFYSTALGRFISADTTVPDGGSIGLNRYAYGNGNPLRWNDPSGHGCNSPDPCPTSAPSPTDSTPTPERPLDVCTRNPLACLIWAYTMEHGSGDIGLILVGGRGGSIGAFSNLIEEFFQYSAISGCSGSAAEQCFNEASTLVGYGDRGRDAAYQIFGVRFIPTNWSDSAAVGDYHTGAETALENALSDKSKAVIVGVVGFSLGANVVSNFFARPENASVHTPYFLIEPPFCCESYSGSFAGKIDFRAAFDPTSITLPFGPFHHDPHNDKSTAAYIVRRLWALQVNPGR